MYIQKLKAKHWKTYIGAKLVQNSSTIPFVEAEIIQPYIMYHDLNLFTDLPLLILFYPTSGVEKMLYS